MKLKRCPCGQIPEDLRLMYEGDRPKWARCSGSCCGEWEIEFRSNYGTGENLQALAEEAWNNAGRSNPVMSLLANEVERFAKSIWEGITVTNKDWETCDDPQVMWLKGLVAAARREETKCPKT